MTHIEKVNPIFVAVAMSLLLLLLLPTGVLDDLRGTQHPVDRALQTRLSGLEVLPLKSSQVLEDGKAAFDNGITWARSAGEEPLMNFTELLELVQGLEIVAQGIQ